jgi:hypothetical protein
MVRHEAVFLLHVFFRSSCLNVVKNSWPFIPWALVGNPSICPPSIFLKTKKKLPNINNKNYKYFGKKKEL